MQWLERAALLGLLSICLLPHQDAAAASAHLRPPNGTYVYAMSANGSVIFKSTIVVDGSGPAFRVYEKRRLPDGQNASTVTAWSRDTMLPNSFEVRQGTLELRGRITRAALTFDANHLSFSRISGTGYVLPSVGLIGTSMMYPYAILAHPGESMTLAEVQNNQTVLVRPANEARSDIETPGHRTIGVIKDEEHGSSAHRERIVFSLNERTGVVDEAQAVPGGAKITLISFTPT